MTRFARAKGSKASNERQIEPATKWQDMKQGVNESKSKHNKMKSVEASNQKASTSKNPENQQDIPSISQSTHTQNTKVQRNKIKPHQRRKPLNQPSKIIINGAEVDIGYFNGFPIKKSDCERLKKLKKEMISRGIPRSEVDQALKLERRKAEKSLTREKKKLCFNCRKGGHILSECPMLKSGPDAQLSETGICFKCGSTEHTHFQCKVTRGDNFKFAQCFVCKEQGHIARQCPDNNKGLYPKGGACRVCGDVTHLKKDCPKYQAEQEGTKIVADVIDNQDIEALGDTSIEVPKPKKRLNKIIKF